MCYIILIVKAVIRYCLRKNPNINVKQEFSIIKTQNK